MFNMVEDSSCCHLCYSSYKWSYPLPLLCPEDVRKVTASPLTLPLSVDTGDSC